MQRPVHLWLGPRIAAFALSPYAYDLALPLWAWARGPGQAACAAQGMVLTPEALLAPRPPQALLWRMAQCFAAQSAALHDEQARTAAAVGITSLPDASDGADIIDLWRLDPSVPGLWAHKTQPRRDDVLICLNLGLEPSPPDAALRATRLAHTCTALLAVPNLLLCTTTLVTHQPDDDTHAAPSERSGPWPTGLTGPHAALAGIHHPPSPHQAHGYRLPQPGETLALTRVFGAWLGNL